MRPRERELMLICALLAISPVLSSLANTEYLGVLEDRGYQSWLKGLVAVPFLYAAFRSGSLRRRLIDLLLLSLVLFCTVLLYRYFILGEAREYDQRPLLHTKNGDPNFICTFLAIGVPFGISQCLVFYEKGKGWVSVLYGAVTLFLIIGAAVTQSRMGLISVGISLLFIVFTVKLSVRKTRLLGIGGLAIAFALFFYGRSIGHRFSTINDESSHGRLKSYVNGAKLFIENPLFGKGWDASPQYFFQNAGYPLFRLDSPQLVVHNTPLQLMADLGLYGFLAYLWLMAFVTRRIWFGVRYGDRLSVFSAASFLALVLNFLTLPMETKDSILIFLGLLAVLNAPLEDEFSTIASPLCPSTFLPEDARPVVPPA